MGTQTSTMKSTMKSSLSLIISETNLRDGQEPFAALLRDLPDAVLFVDSNGQIFYYNARAASLFGLQSENKPRDFRELLVPQIAAKKTFRDVWETLETTHRIENFETQMLDVSGATIDVRIVKTAIRDQMGKMLGFSAVIRDITKTRENEQRISRRNAQLFALIDVAEAVTSISEVKSLLEQVLQGVLRVTLLTSGTVHLLTEDDEGLELVSQIGLNERAAKLLERFELGEGIIGQSAVLAETLLVSDTTMDRRLARPVATAQIGALAAVPLINRGGAVRGVITVFDNAPRSFTEHEAQMLTAIGKQVGIALERNRLLRDVTDARTEWERTFDSMTDGVSIHAPSGKIRRANSSLASMFATTSENLIGMRCCELYHGSIRARADCTIMRTVTERMPQRVELTDRSNGRILRVITDPIVSLNGRIVGVVCTTRDVTDEKLIERRLVQQERISAVGEIAAGIAHEIGTPLNIITANAEFLSKTLDGTAREELAAIREQTAGITKLIHQLLDFSRDQSPNFASVNINNLIEKTVGLLHHQLERANVTHELSLAQYLPTVDGDAAQLQQVLFNLITNALQAMEMKQDKRVLRIVSDSALMPTETFNRPHIVIKIGDTGAGIPTDALPNVFNPFFTANKEGGTGLGLAISYRIVQKHLGTLLLENNLNGGATAQIRLPLAQN